MRNQAARREDMANARNGREDWADGYELRGGHHYADPHDPRGYQGHPQDGEPEPEYDPRYYAPNPDEPYGYDDDGRPLYYEPEQKKLSGGGRNGLVMIGIVAALALLGGAGAVGYKVLKSGGLSGEPPLIKADTEPVKTIEKQTENQASNKAIYDRVDLQADAKSKMVSREEQPVDLPSAPAGEPRSADSSRIILPGGPASAQPTPPDTQGSEPRKVKTMAIRPTAPAAEESRPPANDPIAEAARTGQAPRSEFDDGIMTNEGAAPRTEPRLAAAPTQQPARATPPAPRPAAPAIPAPQAQRPVPAPAAPVQRSEPAQVAAVQPRAPAPAPAPAPTAQPRPAAAGGGFVVQVTSQRSEADARTAYSSLQRKFPQVLGPYQPSIQTATVGDRGTYYRVRVGPFGSSSDASTVCNNLRAAGGDCVVARN